MISSRWPLQILHDVVKFIMTQNAVHMLVCVLAAGSSGLLQLFHTDLCMTEQNHYMMFQSSKALENNLNKSQIHNGHIKKKQRRCPKICTVSGQLHLLPFLFVSLFTIITHFILIVYLAKFLLSFQHTNPNADCYHSNYFLCTC